MAEPALPTPPDPSENSANEPQLWCMGVDHHSAPVDLRERLSVPEAMMPDTLQALCNVPEVSAVALLSTCNRLEIYAHGRDCCAELVNHFAETVGVDPSAIRSHSFTHRGPQAVRHLFRVIASLESMVIGEYQIVHQVKVAHQWSRSHGRCSGELDRLFQHALAVAKDVRSNTGIGQHKVSVASVGVDLARHIHGDLAKARLLVIGAGEIAELATVHLLAAGVKTLTLINRTHENALNLAANERFSHCEMKTLRWADMQTALANHDIVLTSTAAPRPVITTEEVRLARRRCLSPLVFIDLAVPRDVEVGVGELSGVFRYDLDHLDRMVASNRDLRTEDIQQVEAVVEAQLHSFNQRQALAQNPLPAEISRWFDRLIDDEFQRLSRRLDGEQGSSEKRSEEMRYALQRLAGKLRHRSLAWLQQAPDEQQRSQILRELFDL